MLIKQGIKLIDGGLETQCNSRDYFSGSFVGCARSVCMRLRND